MRKLLLTGILCALSAFGADITGKWSVQVETDAGSGSPKFEFKQTGEAITGSYSGALGEAKLAGTVKGEKIEFSFTVDVGGQTGKVMYNGTVDAAGKSMKGSVDLAGLGKGTFTGTKN